jgi:hypothetical protein
VFRCLTSSAGKRAKRGSLARSAHSLRPLALRFLGFSLDVRNDSVRGKLEYAPNACCFTSTQRD